MEAITQVNIQSNVDIVRKGYAYFGDGNIPELLKLFSEDVKWKSPGPENLVPWAGEYEGREGVGRFFSTLNENVEFTNFEPREFVAQNNKVVALGYASFKVRATGKEAESDWAMVFTIRNGKIVQFQEYLDTYADVEALRR